MVRASFCLLAFVAASAGAQPLVTKSGAVASPPAGMGQVVFYRPASLVGRFLGCVVHDELATVARLGSGKFAEVAVAPGRHRFATKGRGAQKVEVNVAAGETAFVECRYGGGVTIGAADLSESDAAAFAAVAAGLKRSGR